MQMSNDLIADFFHNLSMNRDAIICDSSKIKKIWQDAGKLGMFSEQGRRFSISLLYNLGKYQIYDFPFWLQRDVIIPLFQKCATTEQKEKYLSKMENGEIICALAITEERGSDFKNINIHCDKRANGYVLNGNKKFISSATFADVFFVVTYQKNSLQIFIIDQEATGLHVKKINVSQEIQGFGLGTVDFENIHINPQQKMEGNNLLLPIMNALNVERFCCAFLAFHVGYYELQRLLKYSKNKGISSKVFDHQEIRFKFAELFAKAKLLHPFLLELEQKFIDQKSLFSDTAYAKYNCVNFLQNVCNVAPMLTGAQGLNEDAEISLSKIQNITLAYSFAGGTQEVLKEIIARGIKHG